MRAAAEGVQDRLADSNLALSVIPMDGIGAFVADGKRIRQILFNLLVQRDRLFRRPANDRSRGAAAGRRDRVQGRPTRGAAFRPNVIDHIFDRFKTHTAGSRHRGVGLGLSIVRSFVELHGGRILIQSAPSGRDNRDLHLSRRWREAGVRSK